jgi:hypothetical protein
MNFNCLTRLLASSDVDEGSFKTIHLTQTDVFINIEIIFCRDDVMTRFQWVVHLNKLFSGEFDVTKL